MLHLQDVSGHNLIVQDEYSYWIQSCLTKTQYAAETASCLRRFLPPFKSPEGSSQTLQRSSSKRVKICTGNPTRILLIFQKTTGSQKELCDDGSALPTRQMELCECLLLLAQPARQKMVDNKTAHENIFGVNFDGTLNPFGANASFKPIFSKDASPLHQFGKTVFLEC